MTTLRHLHGQLLGDRETILARLREGGSRLGTGRLAVLDQVLRMTEAFTAEELAERAGEVHLSTVYRTLALLEELGVLRHVHLSHGAALYEGPACQDERQHLVCDTCGRHVTVPTDLFDGVRAQLADQYGFRLAGGHFAVVGQCLSCEEATDEEATDEEATCEEATDEEATAENG